MDTRIMSDGVDWRSAFKATWLSRLPVTSSTSWELIPVEVETTGEFWGIDGWFYAAMFSGSFRPDGIHISQGSFLRISLEGQVTPVSKSRRLTLGRDVYHRDGKNYFVTDPPGRLLPIPEGGTPVPQTDEYFRTVDSESGWGKYELGKDYMVYEITPTGRKIRLGPDTRVSKRYVNKCHFASGCRFKIKGTEVMYSYPSGETGRVNLPRRSYVLGSTSDFLGRIHLLIRIKGKVWIARVKF